MQKAKEIGIDAYHVEQREKKKILNQLLEAYDDGSKADFFCLVVNLLELKDLTEMLETADERTRGLSKREKAAFMAEQLKSLADRDREKITLK